MVALSSTEAEYKAACFASCEALWLRRLLGDMGAVQEQPTMLLCDNQSCMVFGEQCMDAKEEHEDGRTREQVGGGPIFA